MKSEKKTSAELSAAELASVIDGWVKLFVVAGAQKDHKSQRVAWRMMDLYEQMLEMRLGEGAK